MGMQKHIEDREHLDIFFNGRFIGSVSNGEEFVNEIRNERRKSALPIEMSIRIDKITNTIYISTEIGRVLRPLIVVEHGEPKLREEHEKLIEEGKLGWNDLVGQGIIEYLDASEEENAFVALRKNEIKPENTHL